MPQLILDIYIPAERLMAVYQGQANRIQVKSRTGQVVNLPAHHLRPFITREGVQGSFVMDYNAEGKLLSLNRLA